MARRCENSVLLDVGLQDLEGISSDAGDRVYSISRQNNRAFCVSVGLAISALACVAVYSMLAGRAPGGELQHIAPLANFSAKWSGGHACYWMANDNCINTDTIACHCRAINPHGPCTPCPDSHKRSLPQKWAGGPACAFVGDDICVDTDFTACKCRELNPDGPCKDKDPCKIAPDSEDTPKSEDAPTPEDKSTSDTTQAQRLYPFSVDANDWFTGQGPQFAFDGDTSTKWHFPHSSGWLSAALPEDSRAVLNEIQFRMSEQDFSSRWPSNIKVSGSNDQVDWINLWSSDLEWNNNVATSHSPETSDSLRSFNAFKFEMTNRYPDGNFQLGVDNNVTRENANKLSVHELRLLGILHKVRHGNAHRSSASASTPLPTLPPLRKIPTPAPFPTEPPPTAPPTAAPPATPPPAPLPTAPPPTAPPATAAPTLAPPPPKPKTSPASVSWPQAPGPVLWKPTQSGYTAQPKIMWFGSSLGVSPEATLQLMARHAIAGYGWQQGWAAPMTPTPTPAAFGQGDSYGSQALAHARQYMDGINNKNTMLFVYRQVQVALGLYSQSQAAANNPANNFWLHGGATECRAQQPWGTSDPIWDFGKPETRTWFLDNFVGQLIQDPALKGGRTAVFFDEIDQGVCGYFYKQSGCDAPPPDTTALQQGTHLMLKDLVQRLNNAGIIPILSSDNLISAAYSGLDGFTGLCSLAEENLLEALHGLQWVRFYETWPWTNWYYNQWQDSPQLYAANIANAILEAEAGIPTILHSGWFQKNIADYGTNPACPAPPRSIIRPGRLGGGEVEFFMALYLIVQSPGTIISFSSDWRDQDFCWRPEFDVDYGTPLGPPRQTGKFSWARNYTKSTVAVDVSSQPPKGGFNCGQCGSVYLLADAPADNIMYAK